MPSRLLNTLMLEMSISKAEATGLMKIVVKNKWQELWKRKGFFLVNLILPGNLAENTFSFTATTWVIVTGERRGDESANCKLGMIRWP